MSGKMKLYLQICVILILAIGIFSATHATAEGFLKPVSAPTVLQILARTVSTGSDDEAQDPAGISAGLPGNPLVMGDAAAAAGSAASGVRFTNITIPPGSTIQSAHLTFTSYMDWPGNSTLIVYGHDIGQSPDFSTGPGPLTRIQSEATSSQVTWTIPSSWTANSTYQTQDLSAIIQEIIDRSDWASGNALTLMIGDDGVSNNSIRAAKSWEQSAGEAAQLSITYDDPTTPPGGGGGGGGLAGAFELDIPLDEEIQLIQDIDLATTLFTTNWPGYGPGESYSIDVEVTNVGAAESEPFDVRIDLGIGFQFHMDFIVGSGPSLAPGDSYTITSGPRSIEDDLVFDLATYPNEWVPGIPNRSVIGLRATILTTNESNTLNNINLTSFIFPNRPADDTLYDPSLDPDGDGFMSYEDCNNYDASIHWDAEEIPNDGLDNDCIDGDAFENVPGWIVDYYIDPVDQDGDGFSEVEGDCNNYDADIHPGNTEIDNGLDDDCDGLVDEGYDTYDPDSIDMDLDGYTIGDGDCDDLNSASNPGAPEILDGQDNDCDGVVDEFLLIPDWTISEFTLTRRDEGCGYYDQPATWISGQCGIRYFIDVDNIGEDIGPTALGQVYQSVILTDLVNQYPYTSSRYIPYNDFGSPSMIELMACGLTGIIAVIPSTDGAGLYGETNTSNNWAIYNLLDQGEDMDIVFGTVTVDYHSTFTEFFASPNHGLVIDPNGSINGDCPSYDFINFYTEVRIRQNGSEIHVEENDQSGNNTVFGAATFGIVLDPRPENGDEFVIDIQLNSGDDPLPEPTSNNHCTLTLTYDRADLLGGGRSNDQLILQSVEGCSGVVRGPDESAEFGDDSGIGSVGDALKGGSGPPIIGTILVGLVGVVLGWRFGAGRGIDRTKLIGIIISGAAAGGLLGAAGGIVVSQFGDGREPVLFDEEIAQTELQNAFETAFEEEPEYCGTGQHSWAEPLFDAQGNRVDILIHAGIDPVPSDEIYRYRWTLWYEFGQMAAITTEDTPLSLADHGFLHNIGGSLMWDVGIEIWVGGDLYLMNCIPSFIFGDVSPGRSAVGEQRPTMTPMATSTPIPLLPTLTPTVGVTIIPPTPDTIAPKVSNISASPNPIYLSGTKPDKIAISASVNDPSGIGNVTLYYRISGGVWISAGPMGKSGGKYQLVIGPFKTAGIYEFAIRAVDGVGNANCSSGNPSACPGGKFTVTPP